MMGLLSGSASVTRCRVDARPEDIDFEKFAFTEIPPASSIRERIGFLPAEPGADYQIGQHRWAFRVRIDHLKPDSTALREKLKELLKAEREATGEIYVSPRQRKFLREQAENEILLRTTPRSKIIECAIDRENLWIGSTSDAFLGTVLILLKSLGVSATLRTPWLDQGQESTHSEIVEISESWQSILGCHFLKSLLSDSELMVEAVSGSVRMATPVTRMSLSGEVLPDVIRYVEDGAEMLSAKICSPEYQFRFDALNFRVNSLKIETESYEAWEDLLDERLERLEALYDLLDTKYQQWCRTEA